MKKWITCTGLWVSCGVTENCRFTVQVWVSQVWVWVGPPVPMCHPTRTRTIPMCHPTHTHTIPMCHPNFNSNFYCFCMASETLGLHCMRCGHMGCALLSSPSSFKISENSDHQKNEQPWEYVPHIVVVIKCGNLWHKKYMRKHWILSPINYIDVHENTSIYSSMRLILLHRACSATIIS